MRCGVPGMGVAVRLHAHGDGLYAGLYVCENVHVEADQHTTPTTPTTHWVYPLTTM